ncbi:MAG: hypothetical protein QOJ86_4185 [Bradyrhizobium sp.]|nr:hypothetical protein [Bradyrhizobium sp.]
MRLRKVGAAVMAAGATVEVATGVVTAAEGIFTVAAISAAMAVGISAAGISAAVCISAVGATSAAARLCGPVFAAIVLSPSITPDQTPYGR